MNINILPKEIIIEIFTFCPIPLLKVFKMICKRWYKIINEIQKRYTSNDHLMFCCAEEGYISLINYLKYQQKIAIPYGCFYNAAEKGNLEMLQWLSENEKYFDDCTFSYAIEGGNKIMLEWLYKEKCDWDDTCYSRAIEREDIELLQWLLDRDCWIHHYCYEEIEYCQNIKVLKWFQENISKFRYEKDFDIDFFLYSLNRKIEEIKKSKNI